MCDFIPKQVQMNVHKIFSEIAHVRAHAHGVPWRPHISASEIYWKLTAHSTGEWLIVPAGNSIRKETCRYGFYQSHLRFHCLLPFRQPHKSRFKCKASPILTIPRPRHLGEEGWIRGKPCLGTAALTALGRPAQELVAQMWSPINVLAACH